MPRGYPDYFGQSIWPKFGTMMYGDVFETVDPADSLTVINLSMQGQMYWIYLRLDAPTTPLSFTGKISIDQMIDFPLYETHTDRKGVDGETGRIFKCTFDDSNKSQIVLMLSQPIPFHDTFKLTVTNDMAGDLVVYASYGYYIIT